MISSSSPRYEQAPPVPLQDLIDYLDYVIAYHSPEHSDKTRPPYYSPQASSCSLPSINIIQAPAVVLNTAIDASSNTAEAVREKNKNKKEEEENSRAKTAAIVGGIGVLVFSALSAWTSKSSSRDQKSLEIAPKARPQGLINIDHQTDFCTVADEHETVLLNRSQMSRTVSHLTIGLLASTSALFVSGMLGAQWLITASIISALAISAITIYKIVLDWDEPRELSEKTFSLAKTLAENLKTKIKNQIPPPAYSETQTS